MPGNTHKTKCFISIQTKKKMVIIFLKCCNQIESFFFLKSKSNAFLKLLFNKEKWTNNQIYFSVNTDDALSTLLLEGTLTWSRKSRWFYLLQKKKNHSPCCWRKHTCGNRSQKIKIVKIQFIIILYFCIFTRRQPCLHEESYKHVHP